MSMNTSSTSLVLSIESEISKVKENLKGVDESLKRLTGRDFVEGRTERRIPNIKKDVRYNSPEEEPVTRKQVPSGIFARLGAPILEGNRKENRENIHRKIEFSGDKEDFRRKKPSLSSAVARPITNSKSRTEAAAELTKDRASRDRNKRMFGALIGTLQKFQNDEAKQKDKDDQRAAIEKKLEDRGKAEKEELRKERVNLFNQRIEQQAKIKFLQYKMNRVKEHETWEIHQTKLRKFIRTDGQPNIYWLPKISTEISNQLIKKTKNLIDKELEEKRNQFKDELEAAPIRKRDFSQKVDAADECEVVEEKMKLTEDTLEDTLGDLEENCDDILDFEVEEPRPMDEVNSSGKGSNPERVVVQVGSGVNGLGSNSQRRVELVRSSRKRPLEHDKVKIEIEGNSVEDRIVKRERSKERVKVSKRCKNDEATVVVTEDKSIQEVKEHTETREIESDCILNEEAIKKESHSSKDDAIVPMDIASVEEPKSDERNSVPKSPSVEVDHQVNSQSENNIKQLSPAAVAIDTSVKNITIDVTKKKDDSSSSSSSENSDYDDSSSTSDSDSSDSDSSDSTSSTSTDSEKMREIRKKSIRAVRKREEERRRKRSSSNSSSNSEDETARRKRRRDESYDRTAQNKRTKASDGKSNKNKINNTRTTEKPTRRSQEQERQSKK